MEILFCGTSDFALPSLELLRHSRWRLLGVVTQPDRPRGRGRRMAPTPVKEFALEHGLAVFQPPSGGRLADMLASAGIRPDVIAVVAFGQLLRPPVLDLPRRGCINLHPSLLPAYRGPAPIQRAIMNGERGTGLSTMYLSPEMDAGDVILQEPVDIGPDETCGELSARLAGLGAELLLRTASLIERGRAPRLAQDHRRATYAPALTTGEEKIDWLQDATALSNRIRGMNPRPGAHTLCSGKGLKIWHGLPVTGGTADIPPGTICDADPRTGFTVQTGDGRLAVREVQPAGRSRMSAAEFVRGYRVRPGLLLGG